MGSAESRRNQSAYGTSNYSAYSQPSSYSQCGQVITLIFF